MKKEITLKETALSLLYIGLLIPFAIGLDLGLIWLWDNALVHVLNWFNGQPVGLKILVLLIGGTSLVSLGLVIFQYIHILAANAIFSKLPLNTIVWIGAPVLFLANLFLCIRELWLVIYDWNFWVVIEFIFLCCFLIATNRILLPHIEKDSESA